MSGSSAKNQKKQTGRKRPQLRSVRVFPDIHTKFEACQQWARQKYAKRLEPRVIEDLCQNTVEKIIEGYRIHQGLELAKRLRPLADALRIIHRKRELVIALTCVLKSPATQQDLTDLLDRADIHAHVINSLHANSVCSDACAWRPVSGDLQEGLHTAKCPVALLTILENPDAHVALSHILHRFPLPRILLGVVRKWPTFRSTRRGARPKPVPFVVGFKQVFGCEVADYWRGIYRGTKSPTTDEPVTASHQAESPVLPTKPKCECNQGADADPWEMLVWHLDEPELQKRLAEALGLLEPRERIVVKLSFAHDDLTAAEIGQSLGLTKEYVRLIRYRALQKLRASFLDLM